MKSDVCLVARILSSVTLAYIPFVPRIQNQSCLADGACCQLFGIGRRGLWAVALVSTS